LKSSPLIEYALAIILTFLLTTAFHHLAYIDFAFWAAGKCEDSNGILELQRLMIACVDENSKELLWSLFPTSIRLTIVFAVLASILILRIRPRESDGIQKMDSSTKP